jgi:hypothetical protein
MVLQHLQGTIALQQLQQIVYNRTAAAPMQLNTIQVLALFSNDTNINATQTPIEDTI